MMSRYFFVAGLFCAVAVYLMAMSGSWRVHSLDDEKIGGREWTVLLAGQLVYAITCGLETEQSIIIGGGIGPFARSRRRSRPVEYWSFTPAYARIAPSAGFLAPAER
jgi:hypothetical protein